MKQFTRIIFILLCLIVYSGCEDKHSLPSSDNETNSQLPGCIFEKQCSTKTIEKLQPTIQKWDTKTNVELRIVGIYQDYAVLEVKNFKDEPVLVPSAKEDILNLEFFKIHDIYDSVWRSNNQRHKVNNQYISLYSLSSNESIFYIYPFYSAPTLLLGDTSLAFSISLTPRVVEILDNNNCIGITSKVKTKTIILSNFVSGSESSYGPVFFGYKNLIEIKH